MDPIKQIIDFLYQRYGRGIGAHYQNSNPFKVLISCVLSQRTREENTAKAVKNLFSVARTPKEILGIPNERLQKLIKPSGFYRQKSKRIKQICRILLDEYNGKVPKDRTGLMKLPGVGYKTADVTLCYGYGIPAIAIDTHCERIPKRIGIVDRGSGIEEVKRKLESLIPKDKWYLVNLGLVRFGREICKPRNPKCNQCPLRDICEYFMIQ